MQSASSQCCSTGVDGARASGSSVDLFVFFLWLRKFHRVS